MTQCPIVRVDDDRLSTVDQGDEGSPLGRECELEAPPGIGLDPPGFFAVDRIFLDDACRLEVADERTVARRDGLDVRIGGDRRERGSVGSQAMEENPAGLRSLFCLLYTSDAADEL